MGIPNKLNCHHNKRIGLNYSGFVLALKGITMQKWLMQPHRELAEEQNSVLNTGRAKTRQPVLVGNTTVRST